MENSLFQTETINLFQWRKNLAANNGNLVYHFSDNNTYLRAVKELSAISDKGGTGVTGYWHSKETKQMLHDVLNEIVQEKHPNKKIKTEIVDYNFMVAYGSARSTGKKIEINARRIDPALLYRVVQTAYHESEHISQFTAENREKFEKWRPLSRESMDFYKSPQNPVEEDARIAGYTYGRFNAGYLAEEMSPYSKNNWKSSQIKEYMEILKQRIGGTDMERTILLNHVSKNETMPGPKTRKLIIDHIGDILRENQSLRHEDAAVIEKIAGNTFDIYSRVAQNIGNIADINDRLNFIADMGPNALTLDSLSYVYSEFMATNPSHIQQVRREISIEATDRTTKTKNIFSEANQSLKTTKIGNTMIGGGNRIMSKVFRWLK